MILYGAKNMTEQRQAYDLLGLAAREVWSWDTLPDIRRAPQGKPFFPGEPGHEFNLSHSASMALCALDSRPVGADIQAVKHWRPGLPARVCCAAELQWLDRQPDPELGFAVLWSLKECRVKQSGLGLRTSIRDIHIPTPEDWTDPVELDGLWFRVITGPDWSAAICGLTPPPGEILWRPLP